MLCDLLKFWWLRDDNSATILCIIAAEYMLNKSRCQIADYMYSINEADAAAGARNGKSK